METDQATPSGTSTCAICGGSGELVHIDEDVGCRIAVPCWSCQNTPAASHENEPQQIGLSAAMPDSIVAKNFNHASLDALANPVSATSPCPAPPESHRPA